MSVVSKAAPVPTEPVSMEAFVASQLGRQPNEKVVCCKISGTTYRINWKDRTTGLVTRSVFTTIRKLKDSFVLGNIE